jgi:hypothetical protein
MRIIGMVQDMDPAIIRGVKIANAPAIIKLYSSYPQLVARQGKDLSK